MADQDSGNLFQRSPKKSQTQNLEGVGVGVGEGEEGGSAGGGGVGVAVQSRGQKVEKVRAQSQTQTGQVVKNNKKYTVRKRPSPKEVPQRPNDVYIAEKSNFKAQIVKCQRLFDGEHCEVFLHGLGPAIPRAINVALELKKFYQGTVDYSVNTSTLHLIDDLIPLDDTTPASQQTRKVSCVDIRVFRTVRIP